METQVDQNETPESVVPAVETPTDEISQGAERRRDANRRRERDRPAGTGERNGLGAEALAGRADILLLRLWKSSVLGEETFRPGT